MNGGVEGFSEFVVLRLDIIKRHTHGTLWRILGIVFGCSSRIPSSSPVARPDAVNC